MRAPLRLGQNCGHKAIGRKYGLYPAQLIKLLAALRPAAGRMPERELVHEPARRKKKNRELAARLQETPFYSSLFKYRVPLLRGDGNNQMVATLLESRGGAEEGIKHPAFEAKRLRINRFYAVSAFHAALESTPQ